MEDINELETMELFNRTVAKDQMPKEMTDYDLVDTFMEKLNELLHEFDRTGDMRRCGYWFLKLAIWICKWLLTHKETVDQLDYHGVVDGEKCYLVYDNVFSDESYHLAAFMTAASKAEVNETFEEVLYKLCIAAEHRNIITAEQNPFTMLKFIEDTVALQRKVNFNDPRHPFSKLIAAARVVKSYGIDCSQFEDVVTLLAKGCRVSEYLHLATVTSRAMRD